MVAPNKIQKKRAKTPGSENQNVATVVGPHKSRRDAVRPKSKKLMKSAKLTKKNAASLIGRGNYHQQQQQEEEEEEEKERNGGLSPAKKTGDHDKLPKKPAASFVGPPEDVDSQNGAPPSSVKEKKKKKKMMKAAQSADDKQVPHKEAELGSPFMKSLDAEDAPSDVIDANDEEDLSTISITQLTKSSGDASAFRNQYVFGFVLGTSAASPFVTVLIDHAKQYCGIQHYLGRCAFQPGSPVAVGLRGATFLTNAQHTLVQIPADADVFTVVSETAAPLPTDIFSQSLSSIGRPPFANFIANFREIDDANFMVWDNDGRCAQLKVWNSLSSIAHERRAVFVSIGVNQMSPSVGGNQQRSAIFKLNYGDRYCSIAIPIDADEESLGVDADPTMRVDLPDAVRLGSYQQLSNLANNSLVHARLVVHDCNRVSYASKRTSDRMEMEKYSVSIPGQPQRFDLCAWNSSDYSPSSGFSARAPSTHVYCYYVRVSEFQAHKNLSVVHGISTVVWRCEAQFGTPCTQPVSSAAAVSPMVSPLKVKVAGRISVGKKRARDDEL